MLVDFHSHTLESDGTLAPAQLAAAMRARGVSIFSVTDHDTLGAYEQLGDLGNATLISGVEINTTYRGNEVHILGYGFPLDAPELGDLIAANREKRSTRAATMIEQLQAAGCDVSFEAVVAEGVDGAPLGRPHVARALVRAGHAHDVDSAFREFLVAGRAGYVPLEHIRPHDAIAVIARAAGVPVLAHPGRLRDESLIEELIEAGVAGIEVFYPTHAPAQVGHFRAIAERHGLVMTGGSDFHDERWNKRGVGMEIERADLEPFLELVL